MHTHGLFLTTVDIDGDGDGDGDIVADDPSHSPAVAAGTTAPFWQPHSHALDVVARASEGRRQQTGSKTAGHTQAAGLEQPPGRRTTPFDVHVHWQALDVVSTVSGAREVRQHTGAKSPVQPHVGCWATAWDTSEAKRKRRRSGRRWRWRWKW